MGCSFCFKDGTYNETIFDENSAFCESLKEEAELIDEDSDVCYESQLEAFQSCGCGPIANCSFCHDDLPYNETAFDENKEECEELKKETELIFKVGDSCIDSQTIAVEKCGCGGGGPSESSAPVSSAPVTETPSVAPSDISETLSPSSSLSLSPSIEQSLSLSPSLSPSIEQSLSPSVTFSTMPSALPSDFAKTPSPSIFPSLQPSEGEPGFRTGPCSQNRNVTGYEKEEDLRNDIEEFGGTLVDPLSLCPGTNFEIMEPLTLGENISSLILTCLTKDCIWTTDGENHIEVIDDASLFSISEREISILGITFRGATKESIFIHSRNQDGNHSTRIVFEDCHWGNNAGNATVRILTEAPTIDTEKTASDDSTSSSKALRKRTLQQAHANTGSSIAVKAKEENNPPGLQISFQYCSFINNTAEMALIKYVGRGNVVQNLLSLETCTFADNDVSNGSLIKFDDGVLHAQDMRFVRNYVSPSHGLILMSGNATFVDLADESSICSSPDDTKKPDNNTTTTSDKATAICEGIWVEQSEKCLSVSSCLPTLAPSPAPNAARAPSASAVPSLSLSSVPSSSAPTDCYNSLSSLQSVIDENESLGLDATIKVCNGTILDGNVESEYSPLKINSGKFRFECGGEENNNNRCLFFGGDMQILIDSGVEEVYFKGFSFVGADSWPILAAGMTASTAVFDSCQWKFNKGVSGVLVYNNETSMEGQRNLEQLPQPSNPSMSVTINNSFFEENYFSFSSVAIISGNVEIDKVVFRDNGRSRMGVVGAMRESTVSVSSSCFVRNFALLDGIIHLDSTSNIATVAASDGANQTTSNYGKDNGAMIGGKGCTGVFSDDKSCAIDGNCKGDCDEFQGETCLAGLDEKSPDIGETPPPAPLPTKAPTVPITDAPTNGTTTDGGGDANNNNAPPTAKEEEEEGGNAGPIIAILIVILLVGGVGYWYYKKKCGVQNVASSMVKKQTGIDFNNAFGNIFGGKQNEKNDKTTTDGAKQRFSLSFWNSSSHEPSKAEEFKKEKKKKKKDVESSDDDDDDDEESFEDESR